MAQTINAKWVVDPLTGKGKTVVQADPSSLLTQYELAIREAELFDERITHATETHVHAEGERYRARNTFLNTYTEPHEGMFRCPVDYCKAEPSDPCRSGSGVSALGGTHVERLARLKIAQAIYEREADAAGQRAYDRVIAEARKVAFPDKARVQG